MYESISYYDNNLIRVPSNMPSRMPSIQPTRQPSRQPTRQPSLQPTSHPSFDKRILRLSLSSSSIASKFYQNFIYLYLNLQPTSKVRITLSLYNADNLASPFLNAFVPSSFLLVRGGFRFIDSDTPIKYIHLKQVDPGTYQVNVNFSGPAASEFLTDFPNGLTSLTVSDKNDEPPTPQLVSAVVSPNGDKLTILFSSFTDRGNFIGEFSCDKLFSFRCASSSQCIWSSDLETSAYIFGMNCVIPGDHLILFSNHTIRAKCTADNPSICARWSLSSNTSTIVSSTIYSAIPVIQMPGPSIVRQCDLFTVDLKYCIGKLLFI
jgi:hypothetical protein